MEQRLFALSNIHATEWNVALQIKEYANVITFANSLVIAAMIMTVTAQILMIKALEV